MRRDHAAQGIAWTLWSMALALAIGGAALVLAGLDVTVPDNWGLRGYSDLATPITATAGLLIARRQAHNPIGWILLIGALSLGYQGFVQEYALRALVIAPGSLPGAAALAWVGSWSFALFAGPMLTLVPQLFPTGRPLTRRWVPLVWCGCSFIPLAFVLFGLRPGPTENAVFMDNPVGLRGAPEDVRAFVEPFLGAFMALTVLASGAALVTRFRRSVGVEREQLKWVTSSAVFCALAFAGMIASSTSKPSQVLMIIAFMTMPVAIGVAITRYHLYDIDVLINRALVYGSTTAAIGIAFFAGIVVLQSILRPLTGGSEVAVAVSTLVSIALAQPLRRRMQGVVDRRFYRSRYDAVRTLDAFSDRLREEVDLDAVRADLLRAVGDTVQPAHASVWLREPTR